MVPNVLCFSAALLALRGLRGAVGAWQIGHGLVQRLGMARVDLDVPGYDAIAHASVACQGWIQGIEWAFFDQLAFLTKKQKAKDFFFCNTI